MSHAKKLIYLIALIMSTGTAYAAGSATITGGEQGDQMLLEYSGDKLSMGVGGGGTERMILRDGKMFMISGETVIDAGSMMGRIGQQAPNMGADDMDQFKSLTATGRSETIAGIKGDVHLLQYVDGDGQAQSKELVLSRDARAVELSNALMVMSTTMSKLANIDIGREEAKWQAALAGRGVLRADNDFRVVSFGGAPAASRFELPSAPQSLPNLQGLLGGGASADAEAQGSGAGGGFLGGLFGNKAERQQGRVEQRTEQEVDEATDSMVDKAMDKAFGKLFGK